MTICDDVCNIRTTTKHLGNPVTKIHKIYVCIILCNSDDTCTNSFVKRLYTTIRVHPERRLRESHNTSFVTLEYIIFPRPVPVL